MVNARRAARQYRQRFTVVDVRLREPQPPSERPQPRQVPLRARAREVVEDSDLEASAQQARGKVEPMNPAPPVMKTAVMPEELSWCSGRRLPVKACAPR
jgi:hypothetical protein